MAGLAAWTQVRFLPSGYGAPNVVVGDPGGGAWTWSSSKTDGKVFHLPAAGSVKTWSVPSLANSGPSGPLSLGRDGQIWIGSGTTLFSLNTASGQTTQVSLPTVKLEPVGGSFRPPTIRGLQDITTIAVSPVDPQPMSTRYPYDATTSTATGTTPCSRGTRRSGTGLIWSRALSRRPRTPTVLGHDTI